MQAAREHTGMSGSQDREVDQYHGSATRRKDVPIIDAVQCMQVLEEVVQGAAVSTSWSLHFWSQ